MNNPISLQTARYVAAVVMALVRDPDSIVTTCICSECDSEPNDFDNLIQVTDKVRLLTDEWHIVAAVDGWTAVIVGCEGHWAVDPASVGIDRQNWQDAIDDEFRALLADTAVESPAWDDLVCFWTLPHQHGSCGAGERCRSDRPDPS